MTRTARKIIRNKRLDIDGIAVDVTWKRRLKNMYLRICPPDGAVRVTAPAGISQAEVTRFVKAKRQMIIRARERIHDRRTRTERDYVSGENHYLWGKPYRLVVRETGKRGTVALENDTLILTVPEGADKAAREQAMTEFYRAELKRRLETAIPAAERATGLAAREYRVRNMRTRWGTCNIQARRVWINLQLAARPPECLHYVLIHELTHLLERNHTATFHAHMDRFLPDWRDTKRRLNALQPK